MRRIPDSATATHFADVRCGDTVFLLSRGAVRTLSVLGTSPQGDCVAIRARDGGYGKVGVFTVPAERKCFTTRVYTPPKQAGRTLYPCEKVRFCPFCTAPAGTACHVKDHPETVTNLPHRDRVHSSIR